MEKDHQKEMARLVREAALALQAVEDYWEDNDLPGDFSTTDKGYPFSQSLDEQCASLFEWVEALDPTFYAKQD